MAASHSTPLRQHSFSSQLQQVTAWRKEYLNCWFSLEHFWLTLVWGSVRPCLRPWFLGSCPSLVINTSTSVWFLCTIVCCSCGCGNTENFKISGLACQLWGTVRWMFQMPVVVFKNEISPINGLCLPPLWQSHCFSVKTWLSEALNNYAKFGWNWMCLFSMSSLHLPFSAPQIGWGSSWNSWKFMGIPSPPLEVDYCLLEAFAKGGNECFAPSRVVCLKQYSSFGENLPAV